MDTNQTQTVNEQTSRETATSDNKAGKESIIEDAKKAIMEEVRKELKTIPQSAITKDDLERSLREQEGAIRKSIAREISGEKEKEEASPVIKRLVNDPEGFVSTILTMADEKANQRFLEKEKQEREQREFLVEQQSAFKQVLKERHDVLSSNESKELFLSFYEKTREDISEKERMKEALIKYDLLLEKQGAGKAEERIRKAQGFSNTTNRGSDIGSTKSEQDLWKEERAANKKNFLAARNRIINV